MNVDKRYREDVINADDLLLSYLLSTKHLCNLNTVRKNAVEKDLKGDYRGSNILHYQESHGKLEFECFENQQNKLAFMNTEYQVYEENRNTRRIALDFDIPAVETEADKGTMETELALGELNDKDGLAQLRKRLFDRRRSSLNSDLGKSTDRQIEDQDNLQDELVHDMTKLVGSLRQGATAFQDALHEDKFVLDAAGIGVQVASRSLTGISGKLKKYDRKKLGYLFYILATLFMVTGLLITFVIIKLFPAL